MFSYSFFPSSLDYILYLHTTHTLAVSKSLISADITDPPVYSTVLSPFCLNWVHINMPVFELFITDDDPILVEMSNSRIIAIC